MGGARGAKTNEGGPPRAFLTHLALPKRRRRREGRELGAREGARQRQRGDEKGAGEKVYGGALHAGARSSSGHAFMLFA